MIYEFFVWYYKNVTEKVNIVMFYYYDVILNIVVN